jgi:hypothetical protein
MRKCSACFAMLCVATVIAGGCNRGPAAPKLVSVHGSVTMDGKPLPGVVVAFVPVGTTPGSGASDLADANGKYELFYRSGEKGAPVGQYHVSIVKPGIHGGSAPGPAGMVGAAPLHSGAATVPADGGTIDFPLSSTRR